MPPIPKNDGLNYTEVIAVTKSDSATISARAFMVTSAASGNIVVVKTPSMAAGVAMYCNIGQIYPIGNSEFTILDTGTTADTIVAFV